MERVKLDLKKRIFISRLIEKIERNKQYSKEIGISFNYLFEKEEKMKRSKQHVKAQRQGRKRDLDTCQICGSHENTEGHHIIDYSYGGAADEENIITLCHSCHRKVHDGLISLIKF